MLNNLASVIQPPLTTDTCFRYLAQNCTSSPLISTSELASSVITVLRRPFYSKITDLILTALLPLALYASFRLWAHRRAQRHSKDPKTWPVLGSQLEAFRNYDRLLDWTTSFFADDHRTVKMTFLSRHSYYTVDPANVEHILKGNFQNYPKGAESHHRLFDLLGNGILNTDGEVWKMHRKLGSFEFSVKKLKHLISTVYKKNALKLVENLHASNQEVDMQELLLDMTFRSICEVVFGNIFNAESDGEVGLGSVAVALDNAQEMILRRYLCPWWKINRFLNIGSERVFREDMKQFNNFLTDKIERKKLQLQKEGTRMSNTVECQNSNYSPGQDLLSRFLWSQQQTYHQDAVTSKNNNQEMIRDAMTSFVLAGRDTAASTLSWFLYCMCIYPEKQEKIFNELVKLESVTIKGYGKEDGIEGAVSSNVEDGARVPDEAGPKRFERKTYMMKECEVKMLAFARMFADEVLTYEHLQSNGLPYLHSAITETLRLYPAVPRDGKVAIKADILPDGTHLNAGDQVVYVPYAMGRMSFLWGPDALDFRPERWVHDGCFQPQSPFKFSAFQAGPRMCLGKDAAYLQMKLTAALLIRFFRFQMVPNHPVKYRMMNVLTMKHGLRVYVAPREINQEI